MTSLYVHTPWCVSKCPYCDFSSVAAPAQRDEAAWVQAVLADLERDLASEWLPASRKTPLQTLFLGGGTPSLLSLTTLAHLLEGIARRMGFAPHAELSLEANPGTFGPEVPAQWQALGFNRVSLGIQSFDDDALRWLGRCHDAQQAHRAIQACQQAGFERLNLDLMAGLPGQTLDQADADLQQALAYDPGHLSCYQLTIEPDTPLADRECVLPDEAWQLRWMAQLQARLQAKGYAQYEVSAWCRPGHACAHNLTYWRYGDYLGIGSAAHGKLTVSPGKVVRTTKTATLSEYLRQAIQMECLLNQLRLREGFSLSAYQQQTGDEGAHLLAQIDWAIRQGWMVANGTDHWQATEAGWQLLDTLIERLVGI
jgi:oxygen-independent coproporphyrinogen-3 oxidase